MLAILLAATFSRVVAASMPDVAMTDATLMPTTIAGKQYANVRRPLKMPSSLLSFHQPCGRCGIARRWGLPQPDTLVAPHGPGANRLMKQSVVSRSTEVMDGTPVFPG